MGWKRGSAVVIYLFVIFIVESFVLPSNAKLTSRSIDQASKREMARMLRKMHAIAGKADQANGRPSLTLREYQELVFNPPRNYTVFVLFHNDDSICATCPLVHRSFEKIAKSFWRGFTKYDETNDVTTLGTPIFFVTVNMMEGYRQMYLDLDPSKPSLYMFAPSTSPKYNQFEQAEEAILALTYGEYNLDNMLGWVQYHTGFSIPVEVHEESTARRSFNLILWAVCGLVSLCNIYYFGYMEYLMEAIKQANYAYGLSVAMLWLLSGQMYNYMRYTAFMGSGGMRLSTFIYPGRHQYGAESIIIMIIYAAIWYCFIQLIETRERQLSEGLLNHEVYPSVMGALTGFFIAFLALQSIGQMKAGG